MWEVSGEQAFVPYTRQIQKDASTKHPWLSPKLQKTHQLLGTSLQVVDEIIYRPAFSPMCLESARGATHVHLQVTQRLIRMSVHS